MAIVCGFLLVSNICMMKRVVSRITNIDFFFFNFKLFLRLWFFRRVSDKVLAQKLTASHSLFIRICVKSGCLEFKLVISSGFHGTLTSQASNKKKFIMFN